MSLPAKAADRAERQAEIAKRRKQLGYNYETIPKLALGKGLPKFIELSDGYTMERTGRAKDVIENQMFIQVCCPQCFPHCLASDRLARLLLCNVMTTLD